MPIVEPDRPKVDRRADYRDTSGGTRFMVGLLNRLLTAGVKKHALPHGTGGRALDVGCGAQPLRSLIESQGMDYVGLDVVNNSQETVHFIAPIDGDLPPAIFETGPFQFLLCTEVLEHVADWDKAFANMSRLMAVGARLVITCPQVWPLHEEPFDFWRPTIYSLRYYAARAGLRVVEDQQAGDFYDVLGSVVGHAMLPEANWLVAKTFRLARLCAVSLLAQRWLRRVLPIRSKFYLSNYIVLEK